jgi:hypothetical protein
MTLITRILLVITIKIILGTSVIVLADEETFYGQAPVIIDGRTLVPIRSVFEELGFDAVWDEGLQQVTLTRGYNTVVITIGSDTFTVNGVSFPLEVSARIINGRTMLPLRAVVESAGYGVRWNAAARMINIRASESVFRDLIYTERKIELDLPEGARLERFEGGFIFAEDELGKWCFNFNGELVLYLSGNAYATGGDGILRVFAEEDYLIYGDNRVIYVGSSSNILNLEPFYYGTDFNEGYAAVELYRHGPVYLMNKSGELVRRLTDKDFTLNKICKWFCKGQGERRE